SRDVGEAQSALVHAERLEKVLAYETVVVLAAGDFGDISGGVRRDVRVVIVTAGVLVVVVLILDEQVSTAHKVVLEERTESHRRVADAIAVRGRVRERSPNRTAVPDRRGVRQDLAKGDLL